MAQLTIVQLVTAQFHPDSPGKIICDLTLHGIPTTSSGVQQDINQVIIQQVHLL